LKPTLKFSLKSSFIATAVVATVVALVPTAVEVNCDFSGPRNQAFRLIGHRIDIVGRNKTNGFESVLKNVQLVSILPSDDKRLGKWKIKVRSNIHNRVKLKEYEINQFRGTND